ncbi:YjaG family protein [Thorsellia anophelis]|uniref:DUF416 domain-containing protein n=1 Tax=Thorsellia anophelis DSM 18579 TaxID=1123402 RepID=A0A1H9YNW7_9GAMM|nr:DUF416 family protein [Thorsellia anophelis]SES70827.1 hypothetical protein SAMN02583745_00278 [Thorsellia anophelis DSM 18579]
MLKNPLQLRLKKLSEPQLQLFMLSLCERMAINFEFFALHTENKIAKDQYRNILNILWESLIVKNAQINYDKQLEKLEEIIPKQSDYDFYAVHPAIDACQALSEALHAKLTETWLDYALSISEISVQTVANVYLTEHNLEIDSIEVNNIESVKDEWDAQWEIFRVILEEPYSINLVKSLKKELFEIGESNIGLFLNKN